MKQLKPWFSGKAKNSGRPFGRGPAALLVLACAITILLTACALTPQSGLGGLNPLATSEKEALVALFKSAGGDQWKNNAQWMSDQHIARWYGVQYYRDTRRSGGPFGTSKTEVKWVDGLHLNDNGLTGEIPPQLHGLGQMRRLDLRNNQLTGEIPSELGRMNSLYELHLSGNQLTGEIPPQLGNIDWLYHLNLANNRLTGEIPSKLADLGPRLRTLNLRGNQLTGEIPPELDNPRQIHSLYLGGNRLTGCIPDTFQSVQYNDFLLLNLPFCGSGALPSDETGQTLVAFYYSTGGDNWHDNTNWGSSRQTSSWYGVSNRGSRNPRLVTQLKLPENNLTGEIPPELGSLGSLRVLDLRGNNLTGEIPADLANLNGLIALLLSGNKFIGCIPADLASVSINDLSALDLPFCGDEALPPQEVNPALLALYNSTGGDNWYNNTRWFTNAPLGKWFGLSGGAFGGSDGPQLVTGIQLPENNLTGEIPPELGNLGFMQALDLSGNNLTGEIPSELGGIPLLHHLDLANNGLPGEIPPELAGIRGLQVLDLSGNNLTGEIRPELGHLYQHGLRSLRLGGNRLTGCIPTALRPVQYNDFSTLGLPFC